MMLRDALKEVIASQREDNEIFPEELAGCQGKHTVSMLSDLAKFVSFYNR